MSLTATTLAAAITRDDIVIPVTSATGFSVGNFLKIGGEFIGAVTAINGTQITVRGRGDQGTAAVAHKILEPVTTGLASATATTPSDYPDTKAGALVPMPPADVDALIDSYGASGAITPPTRSGTITLNKATAAAMTLAGPGKAYEGIEIRIVSMTAAAHTLTYTAGFAGNTTSSDVATWAATVGGCLTLKALAGGIWGLSAAPFNVTIG